MAFNPKVNEELIIDDVTYRIVEHPAATGMPYGQEGRAGIVYQVQAEKERRALKVFKSRYQAPALVTLADRLEAFSRLPGLRVCQRSVITARRHIQLVREHPDLAYAVLMPWVEGPTWMEVLLEKQEFSPEQSLGLARALVEVLAGMEERGLAHCDLSASNLMLPALAEGSVADSQYPVELVDVEQMYGEELRRPEYVPSGSAGYAHIIAREGVWSIYADRFAGALLISEILGWCDPRVREASWGESYLTPGEIQKPSARYDLLLDVLRARWGESVARLLERAWNSDTMADCATCGHWLAALPDVAPPFQMPAEADKPDGSMIQQEGTADKVSAPIEQVSQAQFLLDKAQLLEEQGDLSGALGAYRQAHLMLTVDSGMAKELALIISQLESEASSGVGLHAEPDSVGLENLFDSGLTAYSQGEWASAKELLEEVGRRRPGYERHGQQVAALLASVEQQIAASRPTVFIPQVAAIEPDTAGVEVAGTGETVPTMDTPGAEQTRKVVLVGKPTWSRFTVPVLLLALLLVFGSVAIMLLQSQSNSDGQRQAGPTVVAGATPSATPGLDTVKADRQETAQARATVTAQAGSLVLIKQTATAQAEATVQAQEDAQRATQQQATAQAQSTSQAEETTQAIVRGQAEATSQAAVQAQIQQAVQATAQAQQFATTQALTDALGRANAQATLQAQSISQQATAEARRQATSQAQQAAQTRQAATAQAAQTSQVQQAQGATATALAVQATGQQAATAQALQDAQATVQARQVATAQAAQTQQAQQATAQAIAQAATAQAIQAAQAAQAGATSTAQSIASQAIAATSTALAAIPGQWEVVSSPNSGPGGNTLRAAAAVSSNDVWAVGAYAKGNGPRQTLIEHWDGNQWSIVLSPNVGPLDNNFSGVAARASNDVWAVGHYIDPANPALARALTAHWDGVAWSLVQSPNGEVKGSILRSVAAVQGGDIWAVGYHGVEANGGGAALPLTLRWNDSQWSVVSSPQFDPTADARLIAVDGISANDVWAVGTMGGVAKTLIMHWNGSAWSVVPSPNVGTAPNLLRGVEAISANDVWAVGYYGPAGTGQALILRWDGAIWKVVAGPAVGAGSFPWDIEALSANDVWLVGNYLKDGVTYTLAERWNGQEWSVVQTPNVGFKGDYIFALAPVSPKDIWGVGWYNVAEGTNTLVVHYK